MEYFKMPGTSFTSFKDCLKPAFDQQSRMPTMNSCVMVQSYPFELKRPLEANQTSHVSFQPTRFLVGGFVGSKICEHKSGPSNYFNLLCHIMPALTPLCSIPTQEKMCSDSNWRRKHKTSAKSDTTVTPQKSESAPTSVAISPPVLTQQTSVPVSSPITMKTQKKETPSPAVNRTVSESSESSWASIDPTEHRDVLLSNPWLSNIVVCVSDSDDGDDSDSEWDCVEDFQSENGEVMNDFKWNGDSLSPISSPVSRTPPTSAAALDDYDSDESDGILISCGNGYVADDEEEARERKLSEERIQDANRRWDQNLLTTVDEADGIRKPAALKQVHFPVNGSLVRIRPMVTWSHAYRIARKGDWERLARDSDRFRERIDATAAVLAPILDPAHREKIRQRNLEYDAESNKCGSEAS